MGGWINSDSGQKVVALTYIYLSFIIEKMMRRYCKEIGIEFKDSLINWKPIPEKEQLEVGNHTKYNRFDKKIKISIIL